MKIQGCMIITDGLPVEMEVGELRDFSSNFVFRLADIPESLARGLLEVTGAMDEHDPEAVRT